jgi:hypothetical protein
VAPTLAGIERVNMSQNGVAIDRAITLRIMGDNNITWRAFSAGLIHSPHAVFYFEQTRLGVRR